MVALVQPQVSSYEICGGQNYTEADLLQVLQSLLPILNPPTASYSLIILSPILYTVNTDKCC
jgi:hypothetical protein